MLVRISSYRVMSVVECRMHLEFEVTEKTVIFLTGHFLDGKVTEKEYALLWEVC